jgi:hypothetical protein
VFVLKPLSNAVDDLTPIMYHGLKNNIYIYIYIWQQSLPEIYLVYIANKIFFCVVLLNAMPSVIV